MGLADELAYMSAAEMAMRIRRRDFSPVEVVDALIARIESRNPSLNAFVFKGFDDARSAAKEAETALCRRRRARPAARRADRDQGPVRLQARLAVHLRRHSRHEGLRRPMVLPVRRADGEGRRHHHGQDQQPDDGTARHLRQLSVRPDAQSFRRAQECRRLLGRQRRSRGRRAGAVRRRHRRRRLDPHPGRMVQPRRLQGLVRPQCRW